MNLSQNSMALTAESITVHELRDAEVLLRFLRFLRLLHPPMVLTSHVASA